MNLWLSFGSRRLPLGESELARWNQLKPEWKQTHGAGVAEVTHPGQECGEVDALWTRSPNQPIGVIAADCNPILLARHDLKAVAALHAGWRGVLLHLPKQFFGALPADLSRPEEWKAYLGPSNRGCCYEFGEDLLVQFNNEFPALPPERISPTPKKLDLITVIKHELLSLGVRIESVHPDCTYCTKESDGSLRYFSYRRGDRNSRQHSIIEIIDR